MNRELLEMPFGADQLRQRKGNNGNALDYVEGHTVIQRLNEALDSTWSLEILDHQIMEEINEVLVLGRLSTGDIVKCQFGSSAITRAKQSGEMVSIGDDLKAATTDCLKKCATMLGVGLHLYGGNSIPNNNQEQPGRNVTLIRSSQEAPDNGNSRISAKQHQYAVNLALKRGMPKKELNAHCVSTYGVGLDYITRKDASALIESMRMDQGASG